MTTTAETPEAETDALPADPLAFRRIWPSVRGRGQQAASSAVLKAFGVLYDAERPLTRAELLDGLLPRLDAYERSYLQAWEARFRGQWQARVARQRKGSSAVATLDIELASVATATDRWLATIFDNRRRGHTLIREADGTYRPGPRAPRMQTADGLVPFTPETRTAQDIADRDASQRHAMELEWNRIEPLFDGVANDLRQRLLVVAFLARRYAGAVKTGNHRQTVNETTLRSICSHLLRADRPAVQRAILERVLTWACEPLSETRR